LKKGRETDLLLGLSHQLYQGPISPAGSIH
jgi:hypothetical protein